jgi:ribosomal protein L11 methylase PrmA
VEEVPGSIPGVDLLEEKLKVFVFVDVNLLLVQSSRIPSAPASQNLFIFINMASNSSKNENNNEEEDFNQGTRPSLRPSAAHPTAKAFFDALDAHSNNPQQSERLKRQSQSLGWRNRYSQEDWYPVTLDIVHNNNNNNNNSNKSQNVSFTVQQVQRGEVEGTYGTGATVWPAAMVLLKYLEQQPKILQGKRVVDLGSGTGVTSIAAAWLGAQHVICTDGQDNVVQLAKDNVRHVVDNLSAKKKKKTATTTNQDGTDPTNSHSDKEQDEGKDHDTNNNDKDDTFVLNHCPIVIKKYWWGDGTCFVGETMNSCHVILVADCVLPKLYPIGPLVDAIDELLPHSSSTNDKNDNRNSPDAADDGIAILSYEHRYYPDYDPRVKFLELAMAKNLTVKVIPTDELHPIYCVEDIEIWKVQRQPSSE